jgi:hypothetical protein
VISQYSTAVTERLQHISMGAYVAAAHSGQLGPLKEPIAEHADKPDMEAARSRRLLAAAVGITLRLVKALEELCLRRGYTESLLQPESINDNEQYTYRQAYTRVHKQLITDCTLPS